MEALELGRFQGSRWGLGTQCVSDLTVGFHLSSHVALYATKHDMHHLSSHVALYAILHHVWEGWVVPAMGLQK